MVADGARSQEGFEERGALLPEDAGRDGGAVVSACGSDAVKGGNGARFRVRRAVMISATRATTAAPAHIGHGSSVTTRRQ